MLGADPDRVNVNGGAVALGHPIGLGRRILRTMIWLRNGGELGLAAICSGGGQATLSCSRSDPGG